MSVGSGSTRDRNRLQVVDVLRRRGSASRAEIVRETGLSRATVSGIVAAMQDAGVVVERADEAPRSGSAGGRPAVRISLSREVGSVIGVDFGHSHLRVAIADLSSRVLAERRQLVDVDRSANEALDRAAELVFEVMAEAGVARDQVIGVGMGMPGPIDRETGVVGSTIILEGWHGMRPADELGSRLDMAVEVDNDANLGALGELTYGAGVGAKDLVYLKIASGIGAGIVLDGRLFRGSTGVAGELGHILVNPDGPLCRCGNRGCLETVVASRALLDLVRPTQDLSTLAEIVDAANAGDIACGRVLADAGRATGRALAMVCNTFNPERIVIGGELSGAGATLLDGIHESLRRFSLPAAHEAVELLTASLGDRAEVLGALRLVIGDTDRVDSARLITAA